MTRGRVGLALVVLGLLGIVWGVLHVVEAANGPGLGPRRFESYNQVKEGVHGAFLGGCLRAGIGFALIAAGARLRRGRAGAAL